MCSRLGQSKATDRAENRHTCVNCIAHYESNIKQADGATFKYICWRKCVRRLEEMKGSEQKFRRWRVGEILTPTLLTRGEIANSAYLPLLKLSEKARCAIFHRQHKHQDLLVLITSFT